MSLAAPDLPAPEAGPIDDRRSRELVGCALWAVAALLWTLAMVVPWFRAGVLAEASLIEAGGALRTGLLGIPAVASLAVLLLPLSSWVLLALAPARGRRVLVIRVLLWALSSGAGIALVILAASVSAGTYGIGAAAVVLACLLGAAALTCSTVVTGPDQR